jgi:hypothetical protein
MKKLFALTMLVTGIALNSFGQNDASDKTFEVPDNILMSRKFEFKLNKGNKMKLELSALVDLERVSNVDSLLRIFLLDIAPLKDSLSDPLTSKRIDHVTDTQGRKKIRLNQFKEKGASFLVKNGELASLRTAQDTIHLIGIISNPADASGELVSRINPRYYHYTFYINDMNELEAYLGGTLTAKINTLQKNVDGKWPLVLGTGSHYLKADKTITADRPRGITEQASGGGSFITFLWSVNVQNYKNYFVPSFSMGTRFTLTNRQRNFKWVPGFYWEPHFLFSRDSIGKLRTFRNDFLTLQYSQGGTTAYDAKKAFSFSTAVSLGYLIRRKGEFFEKNTFRLGAGNIQFQKTNIEPFMYFNNFFKSVTPAIRITQYF